MNHQRATQSESQLLSERMLADLRNKAAKRRLWDRIADALTGTFGTLKFLLVNIIIFIGWIAINTGTVPGLTPFDPYPFGFLTMSVSLEAIFLAIIVLISQNRQSKEADLRQEVDLIVNVRAEEEITRIINMIDEIHDHLGLNPKDDAELTVMKQKTNLKKLWDEVIRRG